MTRARQWSEAALAVTAIGLARVVPRRVLHGFGRLVGAALGRVDARHTGIARDNLHRALGGGLEDAAAHAADVVGGAFVAAADGGVEVGLRLSRELLRGVERAEIGDATRRLRLIFVEGGARRANRCRTRQCA